MFDLGRSFLASVERSPDAVAIVDGERRLTYADWYAEICRVAEGLVGLGLRARRPALPSSCKTGSRWRACIGPASSSASSRPHSTGASRPGSSITVSPMRRPAPSSSMRLRPTRLPGLSRARDLPRVAIGGAEGGSCRFDEWPACPLHAHPASRTRGSVPTALHLGHDRAAERRTAAAPRRACGSARSCRAKPLWASTSAPWA